MKVSEMPMMACGHAAQGHRHMEDGSRVPSCITCSCIEVEKNPPDLSHRRARCAYWEHGGCRSEEPSGALPFFEYLGPDSPESRERCQCGLSPTAHFPYWRVDIRVDRRWFKIAHSVSVTTRHIHAEDAESAAQLAEHEANFFRTQTRDKDTKVFSATVQSITPARNERVKCKAFVARGPAEFDKFYCGCRGWD